MGFWDDSGISWTICEQPVHRTRQITTATPHHSIFTAMLCIRGTSHGPVSVRLSVCLSVRPSVRPSQVDVLLKRLKVGSHKQHRTIAQGL